MKSAPKKDALYLSLLGYPNAGKSTLMNEMAGRKISIVTRKAQTTRDPILGIINHKARRLHILDAPGISRLGGGGALSWERAAWLGAEADAILLVIDAARKNHPPPPQKEALREALRQRALPVIIILNKIDLIERSRLLALARDWSCCMDPKDSRSALFMVSAKSGDGVADLLAHLAAIPSEREERGDNLPPAKEMSRSELAAEITREKLYMRLHDEIPYETVIETDAWEDRADGSAALRQTIWVGRERHKALVIGRGGQTLRAIGADSRREMRELFARPIHLRLTARARKKSSSANPKRADHGVAR